MGTVELRGRRPGLGVLAACAAALALVATTAISTGDPAHGSEADRCDQHTWASFVREHQITGTGERVVVIGDSYSVGLGLHRPTTGWTSDLPGRVHVFGFSGSGFSREASPCPGVAYDQRAPRALATNPDLVVIEGGLNDFDKPAADIRAGYRRLLAEVGTRRVVVIGPAEAPQRADGAARVDAILREETTRTGTPYVSMLGDRFSYLRDRLHLTASGHRAFGADIVRALRADDID